MIRIGIVEDESEIMSFISHTIEQACEAQDGVQLRCFNCAEDLLRELEAEVKYDILCLDIELPGISGIELGHIVKNKYDDIKTIFLTAYSEFAAESYEIEAYQYILKSNIELRLPQVIKTLCKEIVSGRKQYRWISNNMESEKIFYQDVIYIRKVKGAKYIEYTTTTKKRRERTNLESVKAELQGLEFIMVERGHIINMRHISRVTGNTIYLDNGEEVTISRARIAKVKEQINEFWRNTY